MTIQAELDHDQYQLLLLAMGMAAGCARRDDNTKLFTDLIRLANVMFANDPAYRPYEV